MLTDGEAINNGGAWENHREKVTFDPGLGG